MTAWLTLGQAKKVQIVSPRSIFPYCVYSDSLSVKSSEIVNTFAQFRPNEHSNQIRVQIDIHFVIFFLPSLQTSEGMDRFAARVNLEVQWASEQTIAAVERNGGVITAAYFDIFCVNALSDPKRYFSLGHPVSTLVCL